MKKALLIFVACAATGAALARSPLLPERYESKATIVSLTHDNMFPKATGTVEFMKPCGAQFERIDQTIGELNELGHREIKVEVILSRTNGPSCLALPRKATENFELNTSNGPVALVRELTANAGRVVLECLSDRRPVDGALIQVQLIKLSNQRFNVAFTKQVAARTLPDGVASSVLLASQLRCKISSRDSLLVSCNKSSTEFDEPMNSGFSTRKVSSTGIGGNGTIFTQESLVVEIYSPELADGATETGFPSGIAANGQVELKFPAKDCRAL